MNTGSIINADLYARDALRQLTITSVANQIDDSNRQIPNEASVRLDSRYTRGSQIPVTNLDYVNTQRSRAGGVVDFDLERIVQSNKTSGTGGLVNFHA